MDGVPADFPMIVFLHLAAEDLREELATEAEPEQRPAPEPEKPVVAAVGEKKKMKRRIVRSSFMRR